MKKRQFICVLAALLILPTVLVAFLHSKKIVPPGMQRVYLCISEIGNTPFAYPSHTETVCTYDKYGNMLTYKHTSNGSGVFDQTIHYTYDTQNRLLSSETYNKNGKLTLKLFYTYEGLKTTISGTRYRGNLQEPYNRYFIYDSQGKLLEDDSTIYSYDAAGNLIKTESTVSDSYVLYEYDTHGNLLTETHYEKGIEVRRYENTYDNRGNKIEEDLREDGKHKYYRVYTYDQNNNCIEDTRIEASGTSRRTFTYDSQNRLRSETIYGSPNVTYTRTYDQYGNKTSICLYERGELASVVKYRYAEFILPIEQAKKVLEWQEEIFGQLYFP